MRRVYFRRLPAFCLCLNLLNFAAQAQDPVGAVEGIVVDRIHGTIITEQGYIRV